MGARCIGVCGIIAPGYLGVIKWLVVRILGDHQRLCLGLLSWYHFRKSRVGFPGVCMCNRRLGNDQEQQALWIELLAARQAQL